MNKLVPTAERVLVREDSFKYEGIIAIPDKMQRRPTTGVIIAMGDQVSNTVLKVGKHVLFAQFSGTGIQLKGQPAYRVLSPDEILLIIEGDVEIEEVSA